MKCVWKPTFSYRDEMLSDSFGLSCSWIAQYLINLTLKFHIFNVGFKSHTRCALAPLTSSKWNIAKPAWPLMWFVCNWETWWKVLISINKNLERITSQKLIVLVGVQGFINSTPVFSIWDSSLMPCNWILTLT